MTTTQPTVIEIRYAMIHTDNSKPSADSERLSVIRFKTPSDKKDDASYKKPPTVCFSIPKIAVTVAPVELATALQDAFEAMQDEVIRDKVETFIAMAKEANATVSPTQCAINVKDISPTGVAAWKAAQAISKRLSKESLETWFDTMLADNLLTALANKLSVPSDATSDNNPVLKQINANIATTRKLIASLASPRSSFPENVVLQLQRAVALADDDGNIKSQLSQKLAAFLQPAAITLELNL